jgi:hypothetical protein
MAIGTVILLVAFLDAFVGVLRDGGKAESGEEPARIE